jgi:hypothetical protein
MKRLAIILAVGLVFLTANIWAQKTEKVVFSSVYTNLDKDCKTLKGGEGQDDAYDCKGVGGYRVYVGSSAATQMIQVSMPGKDGLYQLATQNFDFNQAKIKVEWRLANGKPFAVIARFFTYGEEKANEYDYFGKKTGEELKVVGLKGFEELMTSVDAKTPNANAKARELADNAYREKNK